MKDIILLNPPSPKGSINEFMPQIGLAYIAAYLRENNKEVQLVDFSTLNVIPNNLSEIVKDYKYVGCYANDTVLKNSLDILKIVKKKYPEKKTMLGGTSAIMHFSEILKENHEIIDVLCIGEGEQTTLDIVNNKKFEDINGIAYYKNKKVKSNARTKHLDLNKLPFPAFDLIPRVTNYEFFRKRKNFLPMITTRGCPHACSFCSVTKAMGSWRCRSVENITKEIEYWQEKYGIEEFAIMDDNFSHDLNRVEELCDALIKGKYNISWQLSNGMTVRGMTKELLKKMKDAGCWCIAIAPEVGSEKIRKKKLFKNVTNEEFIAFKKICDEVGIFTLGFFIFGLPWENKKNLLETIKFAKELDCDEAQIKSMIPFKGTPIRKEFEKIGVKINDEIDFSKTFTDTKFVARTKFLSRKELEHLFKKTYLEFYNPIKSVKILTKLLRIGAFYGFFYYLKNSIRFLKTVLKR